VAAASRVLPSVLLIDDAIAAQLVALDRLCAELEQLARLAREYGLYALATDLRRDFIAIRRWRRTGLTTLSY